MYIDYLSLQKTGKWNAMHVRIAWEIYNHQHKNTDPSKSQPSSLNPSSSAIRDSNSRILSNELTKKPNLESDKSKFAPPVISRTGERPNPFGVENRIQNSMPKTSLASSLGKINQCDQIWRNFATFAKNYTSFAILKKLCLVFGKISNILWHFYSIGQLFIVLVTNFQIIILLSVANLIKLLRA